jgi:hypothetical protein
MIGKVDRVKLREVWRNEAKDFTKWLEENIDVLNDITNLNLVSAEREKSAGKFSVDLVAEDSDGATVVIENQLEKSDHDHLGKLITYLTSIEAKIALWIVSDPRPEHIRAISWLNESSSASFYLIKVEAIQIGKSEPAPLFTLIVGPSEESKDIGQTKKEISERHKLRHMWWVKLLEIMNSKTKLFNSISPSEYSWIGKGSGKRGVHYNFIVTQDESGVELYIDRGKDSDVENENIFNALLKSQEKIESDLGEKLDWQRLEGKRACRIKAVVQGGYRNSEDEWGKIHSELTDVMIRFEKAFKPFIEKLKF